MHTVPLTSEIIYHPQVPPLCFADAVRDFVPPVWFHRGLFAMSAVAWFVYCKLLHAHRGIRRLVGSQGSGKAAPVRRVCGMTRRCCGKRGADTALLVIMTVPTPERSLERSPCPFCLSLPISVAAVRSGRVVAGSDRGPDDLLACWVRSRIGGRLAGCGIISSWWWRSKSARCWPGCAHSPRSQNGPMTCRWACVPGSACVGRRPAGIVRLFGGRGWRAS
jgi:hypothetical protein